MNVAVPAWQQSQMTSHQMHTNRAFTPVTARRSFASPLMAQSSKPTLSAAIGGNQSASEKAKREWPEPVRHYVQRAFATENNILDVTRQEMEAKLKKIISNSAESNTLNSVDWENLPLPQQMILEERAKPNTIANSLTGDGVETLSLQGTNVKSTDESSKKRKSSEMDIAQSGQGIVLPWHIANQRNVFEDRITHPEKRQRNGGAGKGSSKSQQNLATRKKRFEDGQPGHLSQQPFIPSRIATSTLEVNHGPVIGRCQDLEKKYFRLTSAPNPGSVRPLPVLERTLEFLKKKWKKENNYSYICDQFKSLRQDLTVQHIKTEFTVSVYEIHARIALEKGDLGEYNQCQTQLRALYSQHLGGHPEEFKAYRILYFIHTSNRTDMNDVLADLTAAEKRDPAVKHALDARSALALGNYHRFFQLYLDTPNMGAYLMDIFVARERLNALSNICTSYKPDIRLRFFTEELGFESDDESARFICDHGGQTFLGERDGEVRLLTGKASRFFEAAKIAAFKKVDIKGQI